MLVRFEIPEHMVTFCVTLHTCAVPAFKGQNVCCEHGLLSGESVQKYIDIWDLCVYNHSARQTCCCIAL